MKSNLISVIVTVYNREKYLKECLDSIKSQTYNNFEVIIVDDGSTDNSLNIAKSFVEDDSRFKLITSEHIGFPLAKNLGLDNCTGDYIIFLDSDDSASPYWLEVLYTILVDTNADISACNYDEYYNTKKPDLPVDKFRKLPLIISEHSFLKMNLLCENTCSSYMWNKLVKRALYNDIRFVDQIALSDISTTYKIFDKADKVVYTSIKLVHYRRHTESMGYETSSKGLDYYIFRANVLKKLAMFIWEHYKQSRFPVQVVLANELRNIQQKVSKENFIKYIACPEFAMILKTNVSKKYLNKTCPERK